MEKGTGARKRRPYRMERRQEVAAKTRQRIIDVAVRLHTSIGPSLTTISEIADQAGVSRLTVYRHFESGDDLFEACRQHWSAQHASPDLSAVASIPTFELRVRLGLGGLYAWYDANGGDLYPIYRDEAVLPQPSRAAMAAIDEAVVGVLLGDADFETEAVGRRVRATLGHVVRLLTVLSLISAGLTAKEASELAADWVLRAADLG